MAKFNKNEIRVGLFLVVPIVIIMIVVTLKLGYSLASSTIDVYLKIDSLTSVKKGTVVKLKGYTIGRVVELTPVYTPALHFLATMRIEKSIRLSENCSAVIQNQNVIGDPSIDMKNPEVEGGPLQHGDVIEGIEYVNLEAILQDVHILLTTLSNTVNIVKQISLDSRHNLRVMLSNLSSSVSNINKILDNSSKDIVEFMSAFRETAITMKEISKELKKSPMKFLMKGKD
jgi:ABC-type transporter Mla subunit MlaD